MSDLACRHCLHIVRAHTDARGCPHCTCMGDVAEASPRTDREMDLLPIGIGEYATTYGPKPPHRPPVRRFTEPDLSRYDETVAQMADPERYAALRALTFAERHPCVVKDCNISQEEHHRLAHGMIAENAALRRKVRDFENGITREDRS